jgi:hemerythrin-like domain-containing protein
VRELAEIGEGKGSLKESEKAQIQRSASEFVTLLRDHINKEDNILYPAATHNLDTETLKGLSEEFKKFEENQMGAGTHEELHRLADELIRRFPTQ